MAHFALHHMPIILSPPQQSSTGPKTKRRLDASETLSPKLQLPSLGARAATIDKLRPASTGADTQLVAAGDAPHCESGTCS